jgi:hypothetical protein
MRAPYGRSRFDLLEMEVPSLDGLNSRRMVGGNYPEVNAQYLHDRCPSSWQGNVRKNPGVSNEVDSA